LRKNGGVVLGRRPGKHTAEGFDHIISRLTVIGIVYISFICIVPDLLCSEYGVPFYLGGTSLMIVVNVVIDLFTQIQTHMLNSQYSVLMKKSRMLGTK
jgi:preprotein translocase subunit SecY